VPAKDCHQAGAEPLPGDPCVDLRRDVVRPWPGVWIASSRLIGASDRSGPRGCGGSRSEPGDFTRLGVEPDEQLPGALGEQAFEGTGNLLRVSRLCLFPQTAMLSPRAPPRPLPRLSRRRGARFPHNRPGRAKMRDCQIAQQGQAHQA
jgi:hypothetical protein